MKLMSVELWTAHIDRYVERSMAEHATPGIALAVTSREQLLQTRAYGYANRETRSPVTDETLFEIGSIGKSFTAICLLQLAEEGVVDLHAPVTTYLPWFSVRSEYEPITLHHLLTHTAGIIRGSDFSPDPRFEVWALRDSFAAAPGAKARYSNAGYKVLGLVLEAITGQPYARNIQQRILDPLAMTSSTGAIVNTTRPRLAVGYLPYFDDRPWKPAHGYVPATWFETNTGDGCQACTAADLAAYLRMFLNRGAAPHGRVLGENAFARMTTPYTELGEGEPYGYGLDLTPKAGRQRLGHSGGMVGYITSMIGDTEAGIGVVALTNGFQDMDPVADFALRTVVTALAGESLPEPETPPAIDHDAFAGTYRSGEAELSVSAAGGRLLLHTGEAEIVLEPVSFRPTRDVFLADHPDFELFPIRFLRADEGKVVALVHGENQYDVAGATTPGDVAAPPEWAAYTGHYRSHNPWFSNIRIVVRNGTLLMIYPHGYEMVLTPVESGFRIGDDPDTPERIAFDTIVDGQALRAIMPGGETYYRFFTP